MNKTHAIQMYSVKLNSFTHLKKGIFYELEFYICYERIAVKILQTDS